MTTDAQAWFLYAGTGTDAGGHRAELRREPFTLPAIPPGAVLAEPLFGAWEGNMGHAVRRQPIDICRQRGEERVVLGNAGVVRVLELGEGVSSLQPGQCAVIAAGCERDPWGYPARILGYDAPNTMGCLATRIHIGADNLIALRDDSRLTLPQWAAFSVRYITAWANWRMAYGVFRLSVPAEALPAPNVWGWGGGTTLAELALAQQDGCRTVMLSGDDRRLASIRAHGVEAMDRRQFPDLNFDERKVATDAEFRRAYARSEAAFFREVKRQTSDEMVHIFVDYIGSPVLRATLKALSRCGVVTTAGWKRGMSTAYLRSSECISRHQHIHTHYANLAEARDAVDHAEKTGWAPIVDEPFYPFDDIPKLVNDFDRGDVGMFPIYSVNPV